ncbi:MAG: hypothetical protein ACOCTH_02335 [Halodesulfurarchaeum sp.]
MDARTKASLLWGFTGALLFLVLAQATRLMSELAIGLGELGPGAVVVFAATTGLGYLIEGRLARNRQV